MTTVTQAPMTSPAQARRSTKDTLDIALGLLDRSGATKKLIAEIRELLVLGFTLDAASRFAPEHDQGLADILEVFCLAARASAKGKPFNLPPIEAEPERTSRPGHLPWCEECIPSPDAAPDSGKVDHAGATTLLRTPDGMTFEGEPHILSAGLTRNEGFSDDIGTEIALDCGGNFLFFDVETAPAMLASLKTFTAQFKAMIEQLPAERQS